ncbi:MAG: hypothetical protein E7027_04100 [Elusimicrobium sp.]|uniref:Uncharacterized protein n=1 Tax=Candidatus Avelusimicrobium gallicola TaxID=2562704 RepID=A0A928DQH8_9BACT|nr:hypothetical protein [Elusimicrobium sp.]
MNRIFLFFLLLLLSFPLSAQKNLKNASKVLSSLTGKGVSQAATQGGPSLLKPAEYRLFCARLSSLKAKMNMTETTIAKLQQGEPKAEPLLPPSAINLGITQATALLQEARALPITSKAQQTAQEQLAKSLQQAERKMKIALFSFFRAQEEYTLLFESASQQLGDFAALGEKIYNQRKTQYPQVYYWIRNVYNLIPVEQEMMPTSVMMKTPEGEMVTIDKEIRPLEYLILMATDRDLSSVTTFENLSLENFAVYAYLRDRLEKSYDTWLQLEDDIILLGEASTSLLWRNEKDEVQEAYAEAMQKNLDDILAAAHTAQADLLEFVDFISKHPVAFAPLIESLTISTPTNTPLVKNVLNTFSKNNP